MVNDELFEPIDHRPAYAEASAGRPFSTAGLTTFRSGGKVSVLKER